MNYKLYITLLFFFLTNRCFSQTNNPIWLDDLKIKSYSEGIPAVLGRTNAAGEAMTIKGVRYERGVGVNGLSILAFHLNGNAREFSALAGVDDKAVSGATYTFYVIGDQKILFQSRKLSQGDEPEAVRVKLNGIKRLGLLVLVDVHTTKTYSNWANAKLIMHGQHIPATFPNDGERYILTPPAPKTPRINSAKVFGATPGNPFLYTVAATGERPMHFSALNLPAGLSLDHQTGIITGSITNRGHYTTTLIAKNKLGEARQNLTVKIGDTIALTPPIGWNGWNSWARNIDREKVISSAEAMVRTGLSQHGWTYINIDDAWQGKRGGKYNAILPNEKFPAFKEMVDHIHGLGLKVGLYSTPWITSYAGYIGGSSNFENGAFPDSVRDNKRAFRYIGKYRFEKNDAQQMAEWGIDYLKYDWRLEVPSTERMSKALKASGRDILYSISNSAPFAHVDDWVRLTNTYRTGPDIRDSWNSLFVSAFTLDKWSPYAGPGHWNDPDMMILGNVTTGSELHATRLTPDEQYSHVSLFSLLAAPLLIGCPIEQLDAFTLNLLTNDEVIAINQDVLGKAARLVWEQDGLQVWLKPLENGRYALGMFHIGAFGKNPQSYFRWGSETAKSFTIDFKKLGLKGKYTLRDAWRQKEIGTSKNSFTANIPHHGVVLLTLAPLK
jgi:alpha-galactosidase